jgi:hypothetical protein
VDGYRNTFDHDLARVGANHAVSHVHQRALARTVLAQQRVHLAGSQREIGPAQGLHGAEAFPDSPQREGGRRVHKPVGWS